MGYRIEEVKLQNYGRIDKFSCNQFSNINLIIGEKRDWQNFFSESIVFSD